MGVVVAAIVPTANVDKVGVSPSIINYRGCTKTVYRGAAYMTPKNEHDANL